MPAKRKKSSKNTAKTIDTPFAPKDLKRAKELAPRYRLVVEQQVDEFGGYGATVLELPNVYGWGETIEDCVHETNELLVTALAYLIEQGEPIPTPAGENKRTEQVNVRLTPLEKMRLEAAADSEGYRGVSDYVRARALQPTSAHKSKPRKAATTKRRARRSST